MSIVKNLPIRRDKQDVRVPDFVSDIKDLSRRFSAAVANNSQLSLAVWEAVKPWDETSVRPQAGGIASLAEGSNGMQMAFAEGLSRLHCNSALWQRPVAQTAMR